MADQSDIRYQAGQVAGQAQIKKDHMMDRASESADRAKEQAQNAKEQAGGFIQRTGEQMKNMAQGAADSVKNAVGMDNSTTGRTTTTTTTTKH